VKSYCLVITKQNNLIIGANPWIYIVRCIEGDISYEFLRWFGRKTKGVDYAVKGGVNLRLFFKSFRYPRIWILDVRCITVIKLQETVMGILASSSFVENLKPSASQEWPRRICRRRNRPRPPSVLDPSHNRFRRRSFYKDWNFPAEVLTELLLRAAVDDSIMRVYKLSPVLVPHYDVRSAIAQKINALAGRTAVQARTYSISIS